MIYLVHVPTGRLANKGCTGEHNVIPTASFIDALAFETYREASEFSQNFGPDWNVADDEDL